MVIKVLASDNNARQASQAPAAATRRTGVGTDVPMERIRNIGIIAHIDAGKTTTTERVLYHTGKTYKVGGVDEGTAVMDFMDQERERGITIKAAATTCYWLDHQVNVIDTPGHVDFTAEVERSLRVLDGGVVVFDSVSGVESQSETVWRQADKYHVPRICFANKLDRIGADFEFTLGTIENRLKVIAIPIQYPLGVEKEFRGLIDLIEQKAYIYSDDINQPPQEAPIPAEYAGKVAAFREKLIEKLADADEAVMAQYMEGKPLEIDDIKKALRRVTLAGKGFPVLCGSSLRNVGVQPLLDAVVAYLPSPLDVPPVKGKDPKSGELLERRPDENEPFAALAFKIVSDPFVGRLVYFRVYSGKCKTNDQVLNTTRGRRERFGRLLQMHANARQEIAAVGCGGIGAALGLKDTFTGDTLAAVDHPVLLESITFPEPVIWVSIEPRTKADQDKLSSALQKLSEEDPTFKVKYDSDTGQTIMSGMGELHLEVLVERMLREFRVEARVGKPQVAYKETITQPSRCEGRFVKQVGGHGQYGVVEVGIEPNEKGKGFEFVNKIRGGTIPKEYINPIEDGMREATDSGIIGGYPVIDIKATLYDGSYHEVDSSEMAFKMAASIGFKECLRRAKPVLLEPIMKLEVVTPEEFLGDIIGDLTSRRARIENLEMRGDSRAITAHIPLSETFGYATSIRSLTQGRATYTMEFHHYQELPASLAEEIISKNKGRSGR